MVGETHKRKTKKEEEEKKNENDLADDPSACAVA